MTIKYLVLSGPSGVGKSTVARYACRRYPEIFCEALGSTTRKPRLNEYHGVHYNFVEKEDWVESDYIEQNPYLGEFYGYSKDNLEPDPFSQVRIFVVNVEALLTYPLPEEETLRVLLTFPSFEEMARRTQSRNRANKITQELKYVKENLITSKEIIVIENKTVHGTAKALLKVRAFASAML